MLNWVEFLHIYQPPNQDRGILDQVVIESYNHIIWLLKKYPGFKITLNVSGSLLEQLSDSGHEKLIEEIKSLVQKRKIELVGSAMFHPILPLLPETEIKRQIQLNENIIKSKFGANCRLDGFYLPEMAYSRKVAKIIKAMGYKWIILDEIHAGKRGIDNGIKYQIKNNGLYVIFRDRKYSKSFPPESIVTNITKLDKENKTNNYLITAHDGELYGHYHKNDYGYYQKVFTSKSIKNIFISDYLKLLRTTKKINPRPANWESTEVELKKHIPYALWNNSKNKIQEKIWELRELAIKTLEKNQNDPNYIWSRKHLDYGLSSCYLWWAAERQTDTFAPIAWNPTEVEKGLKELINCLRSLKNIDLKTKLEAEKLYLFLTKAIWHKHWKKYAQ